MRDWPCCCSGLAGLDRDYPAVPSQIHRQHSALQQYRAHADRGLRLGNRMRTLLIALLLLAAKAAYADCVVGAKLALSYVVVDSHTIILKVGNGILIKSFAFFHTGSEVTVLKDSFCDFESAVLYVDGEVVDAQQVKRL